jgi:hypothetical protein
MAVTFGAILLAWVLWREDRAMTERESPRLTPLSTTGLVEPGDLV